MSVRTGTLYWLPLILDDETLDPTETLLLIALADHVDAEDSCFVGIKRLAARARVSYATARRRLAALEQRGVITRGRRRHSDGNLSVYDYVLQRDVLALNLSADHRSPGGALTSAHDDERAEVPRYEPPRDEVEPERTPSAALALVDADLPAIVRESGHVDAARRLVALMGDQLVERGYRSSAESRRWLLDMEALLRLDKRSEHDVVRVLTWLHTGTDDVAQFWRTNVLSPSAMRRHWQRMSDQYRAKVKGQRSRAQQQLDRGRQQIGLDPDAVNADADELTRRMFGPGDSSDSALTSDVIDVESRGA